MDLVEMLFNNAMNAEGGGGGVVIPEITITATSGTSGTYTSTVPYQEMVDLLLDSPWSTSDDKIYPCFVAFSGAVGFYTIGYHGNKIDTYVMGAEIVFNEDGTCTIAQSVDPYAEHKRLRRTL